MSPVLPHTLLPIYHNHFVPELTSLSVSKLLPLSAPRAMYASPMVVARVKGTANQAKPPTRNPQTPSLGLAATLLCQYDWSTNTVPKFPGRKKEAYNECVLFRQRSTRTN